MISLPWHSACMLVGATILVTACTGTTQKSSPKTAAFTIINEAPPSDILRKVEQQETKRNVSNRPLAKIVFDKPAPVYADAVTEALKEAITLYPDVDFIITGVNPAQTDQVFNELVHKGISEQKLRQTANEGQSIPDNEVHIYIQRN